MTFKNETYTNFPYFILIFFGCIPLDFTQTTRTMLPKNDKQDLLRKTEIKHHPVYLVEWLVYKKKRLSLRIVVEKLWISFVNKTCSLHLVVNLCHFDQSINFDISGYPKKRSMCLQLDECVLLVSR